MTHWITPAEAEQLIASALGFGPSEMHRARNQMESWIEQESIRIVALEKTTLAASDDMAPSNLPRRMIEKEAPISPREWVSAILNHGDRTLWSAAELRNQIKVDDDGIRRTVIYSGVRLAMSDLEDRLSIAGVVSAPARQPRAGRQKGAGGYAKSDEPLLEEMRALIERGVATSPWDAAGRVAGRAKGAESNRQRRLAEAFLARFPEFRRD